MSIMEKDMVLEVGPSSRTPSSSTSIVANAPAAIDEAKLLRKIDMKVMPILFSIYVAAFLDRVNISNALTMSMPKELGLTGQQPNIALTIFFVPYVLFEIPSNILMKKFSPHIWLSGNILGFGIVMLAQGFVKNYSGILATRFSLGLLEAGIFPGSFYLISFWYKREEAQKRFTVYWSSVILASAFGGLLASGIAKMDGIQGLSNWRWIFILEGLFTIIVGLVAFFFVTNFPREATWLTPEEKAFVLAKTQTDESHAEPVRLNDIGNFFKDVKNLLGAIMYFCVVVPIYSFAYFAPTIIKTLGYDVIQTQLHTVPPMVAALAICLLIAYFSDRTQCRLPYILFSLVLTITGLSMLMSLHGKQHFSAQYAGVHLVTMGAFGGGAVIVCWYLMNLHGHVQRSVGSAWMISFGNCGGIVATFSFLTKDAPLYKKGYTICLAVTCVGALANIAYAFLVWKTNRRIRASGESKRLLSL